jgi:two-component system NtrC family sensor kinase
VKLARKLILAIAACTIAILALTGYLSVRREIELIESSANEHLAITGRSLRPALLQSWARDGRERALGLLHFADRRLERVTMGWLDLPAAGQSPPAGLTAAQMAQLIAGREVERTLPGKPEVLLVYVPVRTPDAHQGAIMLRHPLTEVQRIIGESIRTIALSTGAVAAGSALTILLLGTLLVGRPMRQLAVQARRIAGGDFDARLRLRQHDEIGEVAREMDEMAERLGAVTRRVAAETGARLEAMEQLRHAERLATVGQLAAGLAHEVNTPLTVISGRASLIAGGALQPAQVTESARAIAAQAQRIARLVRQMLDFARVRESTRTSVDLAQVTRDTLALLTTQASAKHVSLAFEDHGERQRITADAGQLEQVITNLTVNGIQAMPEGGVLSVRLRHAERRPPAGSTAPAGPCLCLEVADQGAGIDPEHLTRIFEPFFTTKGVGQGTGLGLSVAYGIVQDHGGWIDVESTPGQGSRFTVCLPVAAAATPALAEAPATDDAPPRNAATERP